uniref:G-protein coupled receptor Mth2-like n=1 Tax=Vespula vulgaris TaxID=7454 RepID=UPI00223A9BAB|nr:G-protein coupled receptor Mth2-like [Vespula vulgaris]
MHVRCTVRLLFTSFLFFVENIAAPIRPSTKWNGYHRIDLPKKCCIEGYLFNDELTCVKVIEDNNFSKEMETEVRAYGVSCEKDVAMWMEERGPNDSWTYATVDVPNDYCLEMMTNGTQVLARCPDLLKMNDNSSTANSIVSTTTTTTRTVYNERKTICDNKNRTKKLEAIFWGAKTYMLTNIAHMILCIVVVVTYLSVPELRKGVYNHAVLRHNISLLGLGSILTFLSYCQYPLDDNLTILLWLLLQYFTLATVFWLNVICFDMTLCITRFRWTVGLGANNERDKYRRLLLYGVFAWGGALLPTVVAGIFEYTPGIPKNFPLKPNYVRYCLGPNPTVNFYFFVIPLITLLCNNVLFLFTTYKIIRIQSSTKIATKNQSSVLTKKYFLFLRLYLLMGAPWFFGTLLACLNKLVILKICRLIQPILWLFMLLARKNIRQKIADRFYCFV